MKRICILAVVALVMFSAVSMTYAIGGLGLHYGLDFSMSMKDGEDEVKVPSLSDGFDLSAVVVPGLDLGFSSDDIINKDTPFLKMSRSDWKRSALNIGGKLYVDIIPFIDVVELSGNLGVWQYDGSVSYLDVQGISDTLAGNPGLLLSGLDLTDKYKLVPLTLKAYKLSFLGLEGTPYAKLHFDLSVRKTVLNLWLVKFNAGAGASLHLATPVLNSHLIDKVQVDKGIETPEELVSKFMDPNSGMGKAVVEKIVKELFTPRWGAHIVAGARLKFPVIPLGAYIDGKLMIPISKYDENGQISGFGFLVNTGLSLSI
jgi:hypothetical protein